MESSRPSTARVIPKELESWSTLPVVLSRGEGDTAAVADPARDYRNWEFNIWLLEEEQLLPLTMNIVNDFGFPAKFGFDTSIWCNFIWEVQRLMNKTINPYHTFRHVIDVSQSCACIVREFNASVWLGDLDSFALYVSAIVHDLEHPGTNNPYQVNASTPLAIRYNDISVLENHHCAKAFEVFMHPRCNITQSFQLDQKKHLRKTIISLVLTTDMTNHFPLRGELDSVITRNMVNGIPAKLDEKDTLVVLKCILHTSDISNPARPWDISKKWSDLVIQEFFEQGDREKKEGLPVSMNCDRDTTVQDEMSMNFTDFIVAPLFFSMAKLLPKMFRVCKILETNRSKWNEIYTQRTSLIEDEKVRQENLDKWAARSAGFTQKVAELEKTVEALWTSVPDNTEELASSEIKSS